MFKLTKSSAVAAFLLLCVAACGPKAKPKSIDEVRVAAGFRFQTTHGLVLSLSTAGSLLPQGKAGRLLVSRKDGRVLYDGYLSAGAERTVTLGMPNTEKSLVATLAGADGVVHRVELAADVSAVAHRFE